ncbi:MAG TPA: hypothetical protein QGF58_08575 [Myxococcota bacterium]|nr:hypothetical protein [Myxococcota bacterium]
MNAYAIEPVPPRVELAELRHELVELAGRLYLELSDSELVWAGTTLHRLLEPKVLEQGLDDWVVRAALVLLVEGCTRIGLVGPTISAPTRSLELLDQLDQPPDRRSRYGG